MPRYKNTWPTERKTPKSPHKKEKEILKINASQFENIEISASAIMT